MTRPADQRWLVAFIATLAIVVLGAAVIGHRQLDEPPAPAPAPIVPAPLPPATGIDGDGLAVAPTEAQPDGLPADPEALPPDVQAQPDAGAPAMVIPTPEGIGGEVYVRSPAFKGRQRLNAGFRYPSGTLHGAWDIGIDRGTKVYAARRGIVVGKNDGVRNHPSGSAYAVSGSPSNWVLLCAIVPGIGRSVLYYQHLSPGIKVKRKQVVAKGTLLGRSGNTGNSTGDHLHLSASKLPKGWRCGKITKAQAEYLRYDYLRSPNRRLFAPARFWAGPNK